MVPGYSQHNHIKTLKVTAKMEIQYQKQAIETAKATIQLGIARHTQLEIDPDTFEPLFREKKASFVTLKINNELRGCIGSLSAYQALITDIANNAFNAALKDPRFPPVNQSEFEHLQYHISILNTPESMTFASEEDLLEQLRPNIDGLILSKGSNRGTFLPSVWKQLPNKTDFLKHLKQKAGLDPQYWNNDIRIERYEVDEFSGE